MSENLDAILALAADNVEMTVRLSPESQAVLFYALWFAQKRFNWLSEDPLDEITDNQWAQIEDLVDAASEELMIMAEPVPVGASALWFFDDPPTGWLFCNGTILDVAQYPDLFDIIGYNFGGSGSNFWLPNLTNRTPVHSGGLYATGQQFGAATHTLTIAELPAHDHPADAGNFIVSNPAAPLTQIAGTTQLRWIQQATTGNAGGDGAHNNLQPSFGVKFIIYPGVPAF